MIYQIVSPFTDTIYGDSFKEAIKNYIKVNRNVNVSQMIVTDQTNHIQAYMKYYQQDGRNRVGINMYPISNPFLNTPPVVIVKNEKEERYIPQNIVQTPVIQSIVPAPFLPVASMKSSYTPLSLSPMSPVMMPFIPTVVDMPRGL
jgi:hypothetical protein